MDSPPTTRVLVVANRTAATPWLLQEVEARARAGSELALMVPPVAGRDEDWSPAVARGLLERAADRPVEPIDAGRDPVAAIERTLAERRFDEILVSVRPARGPRRRRRDLLRRLGELDVPVTAVVPGARPVIDQTVLKVRW